MNLESLYKYIPPFDKVLSLLGLEQKKKWLDENIDKLSGFLDTKDGKESLELMLVEFFKFVTETKAKEETLKVASMEKKELTA